MKFNERMTGTDMNKNSFQERLEIDTLGECGILKHPKKFFTTVIKLKTKLLSVFIIMKIEFFTS